MRKKKHFNKTDEKVFFNNRQPWTQADDDLLDKLSDELPDAEISIIMGRTLPSIWKRRMKIDREKVTDDE